MTALIWRPGSFGASPGTRQPRPAQHEAPVRATGYGWAVNLRNHGTGGYGAVAAATSPDTPFGPGRFAWRRMGARRWGETRGRGAVNGPRSARHPAAPAPRRWVGVARALRAAAEPDSPLVIAQRRGVGFAEKGSCPGSRAHGPAPSTARRPVVGATAEAAGERTEEPVRRGRRQVARTVALVGVEVLGPGRGGRRDGGHAARRRT